ncbi:MAG: calcium/sodium antiporter [Cytophagaceae bacterium]
MILVWIFVFCLSLLLLIKAADYFNLSAEKIGVSLGFSPFVIGVVLVAAGTSLPELVTSLVSVYKGSTEIVAGNVIGSNIANIFFIVGFSSLIAKKFIHLKFNFSDIDIQFLLGSAIFLIITCIDGVFNFWEGLFSLTAFTVYMVYLSTTPILPPGISKKDIKREPVQKKYYFIFILSLGLLFAGGNWAIESVIGISEIMNIEKGLIATTAIALGTSLPELFVSIDAFKKNNAELALGNILGSCIFNALAIMGVASLLKDLIIPDPILRIALPFMVFATVLFFFTTRDKIINRYEGMLYILFYFLFLAKITDLF